LGSSLIFSIFAAMNKAVRCFLLLSCLALLAGCNTDREKAPVTRGPDSSLIRGYTALRGWLDTLRSDPCLREAEIGYQILDISEPEPVIVAENIPARQLIPASTLKLFVTGAALELFGPAIMPEVKIINEMSVNWRSSKLLRKIGRKVYDRETRDAGVKAIMAFWKSKGLDTKGIHFDDGNGLSRNNAISAKQLVEALTVMLHSRYALDFYESLPVAGYTGTLRKAMHGTAAQGRIRAKTGTIAGVKSFAGYVRTVSDRQLIFALIINNYGCRTKEVKRKMEKVLVRMAEI